MNEKDIDEVRKEVEKSHAEKMELRKKLQMSHENVEALVKTLRIKEKELEENKKERSDDTEGSKNNEWLQDKLTKSQEMLENRRVVLMQTMLN